MKNTRIIALFLMAIVSTASPTLYQQGIQPRVEGAACSISILNLELDEDLTKEHLVVFNAYLSIENTADVEVVLSRLALDVYHHSKASGRYRLIGSLNTTDEFKIGPSSTIYTKRTPQGLQTLNPLNKGQLVVAKLAFIEDEARGSATSEAVGELIQKGFISIMLKGKAQVGPFEFDYQKHETLQVDFWDPNFVILDVFNYYSSPKPNEFPNYISNISSPDYNTDYACIVVRALMHNPSGIPMVLQNYTFDLYTKEGIGVGNGKIASGISIDELAYQAHDPDYLDKGARRKLVDTFLYGNTSIVLNKNPKIWSDVLFMFNFTDPNYWNAPSNLNATTRTRLQWFMTKLFNDGVIENIYLQGETAVIIGWIESGTTGRYRGIRVEVGDVLGLTDNPPFIIDNVKFHQHGYDGYEKGTVARPMKDFLSIGDINVTKIEINRQQERIAIDMNASLRFDNPYRLAYNITNLLTNYYRTDLQGNQNNNNTYDLANGVISPGVSLFINRTRPINNTAKVGDPDFLNFTIGSIKVPHTIKLNYSTTEIMQTGIGKLFSDLGIDPITLNLTNVFWLMGPEGVGKNSSINPMNVIEYLIKKGIDPILLLKDINTTHIRNYGDFAWYPLDASFFGTDFNQLGNRYTPNKDMYTPATTSSVNGITFKQATYLSSEWGVSYGVGIGEINQYDTVRHRQIDGEWVWEPAQYGGISGDTNHNNFNGVILRNLPTSGLPGSLPIHWLPKNYVAWRIYSDTESSGSPYWGYNYDTTMGLRGWYFVRAPVTREIMLKQNFTISTNTITSAEDIESAWLSISYQFPGGDIADYSRMVKLGIGFWNESITGYQYEAYKPEILNDDSIPIDRTLHLETSANNRLFTSAQYGYFAQDPNFDYSNSRDWKVFRVNVTRYLRDAMKRYNNTGNPANLRMEVAASISGAFAKTVNIDDIVLQVNYNQKISGKFRFSDLMNYLEKNAGKDEGNFFNYLDTIGFSAKDLVSFAESTLGLTPSGSYSPANLIRYMSSTDFSIPSMIEILNNVLKSKQTNSAGEFNFLEMLNKTKYILERGDIGENNINTTYGKRTLLNEDGNWLVEDPYVLSKAIIDGLKSKTFYYENGSEIILNSSYPQPGKELWMMFENLGITMPWLITYLIMSGWSKDDIFDALEAVGFASQTKQNIPTSPTTGSYGVMKMYVNVKSTATILFLFPSRFNQDATLWQILGKGISTQLEQLLSYLSAANPTAANYLSGFSGGYSGIPSNWASSTRPLMHQLGSIPEGQRTINKYLKEDWAVRLEVEVQPYNYEMAYWMYGLPGSQIAVQNQDPNNPYMSEMMGTYRGLNSLGVSSLAKYLRIIYYCQDQVMFRNPGNPVALFQFLDDFFFNDSTYYDAELGGQRSHDYTSYTLLNKYNVLASDFFELAMGWDRRSGHFDPNGNGYADDWVAPYNDTRTWVNTNGWYPAMSKPSLNGWGMDFVNTRIFWNSTWNDDPMNGKVIWSDSRQFLTRNDFQIRTNEDPLDGAPPIINLIDFLLWCTKSLGRPTPEEILRWIEGSMPLSEYVIQHPDNPDQLINVGNPKQLYNCGLGLNGVWKTLEQGTFNITGFINVLENFRKVNVWGLFQEMNNYMGTHDQSPDAWGFIHYLMNPNYNYAPDGTSRIWMYHNGVGGTTGTIQQKTEAARNTFWLLFNGSWWDNITNGEKKYWQNYQTNPLETLPGLMFLRFRQMELEQISQGKSGANLTFNIFQMLYSLGVNPEEWLKLIEQQGVIPFEVLGVIDQLNYTKLFSEARDLNKKTRIKINGTFGFEIMNFKLADTGFFINNVISYEIGPDDYWANDQLRYFWEIREYSTSAGTLSFV